MESATVCLSSFRRVKNALRSKDPPSPVWQTKSVCRTPTAQRTLVRRCACVMLVSMTTTGAVSGGSNLRNLAQAWGSALRMLSVRQRKEGCASVTRGKAFLRIIQMIFVDHLRFRLRLGFVHPLQDVALHQCLPLSSVCCLPNPGGSLLLCYVVLPSSAWSSS